MRLSVITDEISPDIQVALRVCEDLGVSSVELRSVGGRNLVHHDWDEVVRTCGTVAAAGFSCPVIDTPFLKTPLDVLDWAELDRGFELADLIGADTVRIFSGLRQEFPDPDLTERITQCLAAALARAEKAGLGLAMEIEHVCNVTTGAAARDLLADPALAGLGVVWDPGNEAHFLAEQPDPSPIADLAERIRHVHVKDASPAEWVRVGTGIVDWPAQLAALAAIGYPGYLSMETHYQLPDGGGAAATRESVAALRELAAAAGIELT